MPLFGARFVPATAHYKHIKKFNTEMENRETKLEEWQREKEARLKRLNEQGFRPKSHSVCVSTIGTDVTDLSSLASVLEQLDKTAGVEANTDENGRSWRRQSADDGGENANRVRPASQKHIRRVSTSTLPDSSSKSVPQAPSNGKRPSVRSRPSTATATTKAKSPGPPPPRRASCFQ